MALKASLAKAVNAACAYRLRGRVAVCRTALFVLTALLLAGIAIGYDLRRGTLDLEAGDVAPKTIRAPGTVRFVDREATERLREQAADAVRPRDDYLPHAKARSGALVDEAFDALLAARGRPLETPPAALKEAPGEAVAWALGQSAATLDALRVQTKAVLESVAAAGVHNDEGELAEARERIAEAAGGLDVGERGSELVAAVAGAALQPNLAYNAAETEAARREAMAKVRPVERTLMAGEPVVAKDEPLTAEDVAALRALGLTAMRPDARRMAFIAALAAAGMLLIAVVMKRQTAEVYQDEKRVLLFCLVALASLAGALLINMGETRIEHVTMLTVGAGSIMLAVLLGAQVALPTAVALSVLAAVVSPTPAGTLLLTLGAGLTGMAVAAHIWPASRLLGAGTVMAAVNAGLMLGSGWLEPELGRRAVGDVLLAGVYGYGAPVLAAGAIAALQRPFDIATHIRLLELANPNDPLLKRMLAEAPGSYSDSALIANLAGAAAEAIGADALLARVGAFYHDIGKLRRPYFFYENQALLGTGNVHDQISPSLSSVIITSHVKDGEDLAREYGLPSVVREIIAQHHGTSLVQFFYHQASAAPGGEDVPEERFRYPGPKPKTKEAAIVMLADSAFGAVWAMPEKTPERVEATLRQMIRLRVADGQLDESPLTLKDITAITQSFLQMLKGILFHVRIEYPGMEADEAGDGGGAEERPSAEVGPEAAQAGREHGPAA